MNGDETVVAKNRARREKRSPPAGSLALCSRRSLGQVTTQSIRTQAVGPLNLSARKFTELEVEELLF